MVTASGSASTRGLWWKWSWRDLRGHWIAVVVIALVVAIGIGVYAGLGSTATWRRLSNDASFAAVQMHDVRATLSPGTFAPAGSLAETVAGLDDAGSVSGVAERLISDSQVDATTGADSILVRARIVGMDLSDAAAVDAVWVRDGAVPDTADPGLDRGILEAKFADDNGLASQGTVSVAGGRQIAYTGLGVAPEDFFYAGPEGSILSQGDFAILYVPLATAQDVAGRPGEVNDVVLTLEDGADRDAVEAQLAAALEQAGFGATVSNREDAVAVRVLYEDIENDQRIWNALAALVLMAAALAAFNLISRIVEAQRREIGIGMALGVPRRQLAIRPLLVGVQVALLGTAAGVGVGMLIGNAMGDLLETYLPMPAHQTPFQVDVFARAAALGILIPLFASAVPVWRAVRVEPIEAIRTGHLTAKASRSTDWTSRIHLPGSSLTQMSFRNVLRTPRRSILTAVGVGAAITALVAVLGMLDSFTRIIDRGSDELTRGDPGRVIVQLDTFRETGSLLVEQIAGTPSVGRVDAGLRLPATAVTDDPDDEFELLVEFVDEEAAWTPTVSRAEPSTEGPGIVLAPKAAEDLGVSTGDSVMVRLPTRDGTGAFSLVESELTVEGIHPNPLRAFAFMRLDDAEVVGLAGSTNVLNVYPSVGATPGELQRDLFDTPGVSSTQAVADISKGFDQALEQFIGVMVIVAGAVLTLALLIAFNASRITVEERRREHATMRAFGLPVRTVMGVVVKESILVGLVATAIGVAAGLAFLDWMLRSLASTTLPDLGMEPYLSPTTLAIAAVVGIVAVAAAPLFLVGRVRRMNIPDTLRIME